MSGALTLPAADEARLDATPPRTILCVDDEPNILSAVRRALRGSGHRVLTAESGQAALQVLASEAVQLVISDMRMPVMDGAQLLEQVRQRWPEVTRILLTGQSDVASTMAAINRGEIFRYISKPWNEDELLMAVHEGLDRHALLHEKVRLERVVALHNEELTRLNAGLEQQVLDRTAQLSSANARLGKNYLGSIKAFSNLIELRGGSTGGHSRRVAELARRIAVQMKLPATDVQDVFIASLLHDIGHVGLTDTLLACPVPRMTAEDKTQYEMHPALGEQALMALEGMQPVAMIVRAHHERHDGMGFPDGLRGAAIPIGARILAVADTYDDLQSGRLARAELAADDARMLVLRGRDTQFDPSVVDAFQELMRARELPPSFVELPVDQLEPGMVLARDLRSREGVVLLAVDHALSADLIQRIRAHAARHDLSLLIAVQTGRTATTRP